MLPSRDSGCKVTAFSFIYKELRLLFLFFTFYCLTYLLTIIRSGLTTSRRKPTQHKHKNVGMNPLKVFYREMIRITLLRLHEVSTAISKRNASHRRAEYQLSSLTLCWPLSSRPKSSRCHPHGGDRTSS